MNEYAREIVQRIPIHPGAILREDVLPDLELSVTAFAKGIHTSRQTAHKILGEDKGITPEMALKIAKFTGSTPGLWLRMQQNYDLYVAEQNLAEELAGMRVCCG